LLNACSALDLLTTEHPKVMTTLSAILITVGSIPAIPAIAGGAGGAILASGAVHAVGAVAVGVGSWIKVQQESKQKALAAADSSESGKSK
jgi:flagellar biosynthesis component FlhA